MKEQIKNAERINYVSKELEELGKDTKENILLDSQRATLKKTKKTPDWKRPGHGFWF